MTSPVPALTVVIAARNEEAWIGPCLAALAGLGVDNAMIEIDGPELPILDGSSRVFVEAIDQVGIVPLNANRKVIKVLKPVRIETRGLRAWFGATEALHGIDMVFHDREVTAIIGPSGCGKSTFIRCLNRMHELVRGARAEGQVILDDVDVYRCGHPHYTF